MNAKLIINLVICVLLLTAVVVVFLLPNPADKVQPVGNDNIRVAMPLPGTTVHSPLVVQGEARGTWYFEASFPVKLLDSNGKVLVQAPAQAKGEWMTTEFVPFEISLPFETPTTDTGTLVLEKDNPSGLPQNDASVSVPVIFK